MGDMGAQRTMIVPDTYNNGPSYFYGKDTQGISIWYLGFHPFYYSRYFQLRKKGRCANDPLQSGHLGHIKFQLKFVTTKNKVSLSS